MARFVWSSHAQEQLRERKISKQIVLSVFRKPDNIIRQTTKRWRAMKLIRRNGKEYLLVVIYDEVDRAREIITAFITSKINKYL